MASKLKNKGNSVNANEAAKATDTDIYGDSGIWVDHEYYQIGDRADVSIKKTKARYEITKDGNAIMVPYSDDQYFVKNKDGSAELDKSKAHYDITKDGDLVVVPNNPLMSSTQLYV